MLKNLYDLDSIKSDNYRNLDMNTVEKLRQSILAVGLQEPIQLFQVNETGELFVVSGHHRLEAIRQIKAKPQHQDMVFQAEVVRGSQFEYRSQNTAIKSVMANSMRKDMVLVDRAKAYQKLLAAGLDVETIALMVDKDDTTIRKTLLVAKLPEKVLDYIQSTPKLRDSLVYKFAAKYNKDSSFDVLAALSELQTSSLKRQGARTKTFRVDKEKFSKKLEGTGEFSPQQIDKILGCLSTKGS